MTLPLKASLICCGVLTLAGCTEPLDFDLRGQLGAFSTAPAARSATANRPAPDERGVITYPNYQVAVAQVGDTFASLSARVGLPADEVADFNGVTADTALRDGEVVALPRRVGDAAQRDRAAQGAGNVDIVALADQAIEQSDLAPSDEENAGATTPSAQPPAEPIRHRVVRGETAFSIARLYNVPVRTLADWNGLGPEFSVREGQFLLIPTVAAPAVSTVVTAPGEGSQTPTPPSASRPLPEDDTAVAVETPTIPDIGETSRSDAAMAQPVEGAIIRPYAKGRNEGIDIKGAPGAQVVAADTGTVAAITRSAEGVPIIVLRHPDNVLTVYANVTDVKVSKGDQVTRGTPIAALREGDESYLHFEVRQGFDSVDPTNFL